MTARLDQQGLQYDAREVFGAYQDEQKRIAERHGVPLERVKSTGPLCESAYEIVVRDFRLKELEGGTRTAATPRSGVANGDAVSKSEAISRSGPNPLSPVPEPPPIRPAAVAGGIPKTSPGGGDQPAAGFPGRVTLTPDERIYGRQ